jgi:1-deoxy-D-xylulose-5-phosphate synthase
MLCTGFAHDGPAAVRYPRGTGPGSPIDLGLTPLPMGKAEVRRRGRKVALLAFGSMVQPAQAAADQLDATLVNMRFIKPLDEKLLLQIAGEHELLVTIEENAVAGGAGSAVAEFLSDEQVLTPVIHLGLPDRFIEHGDRMELLADCGLDTDGIIAAVRAHSADRACHQPPAGVKS